LSTIIAPGVKTPKPDPVRRQALFDVFVEANTWSGLKEAL